MYKERASGEKSPMRIVSNIRQFAELKDILINDSWYRRVYLLIIFLAAARVRSRMKVERRKQTSNELFDILNKG